VNHSEINPNKPTVVHYSRET